MIKLNMTSKIKKSVLLAAACLLLGVSAGPFFAEELAETETETIEEVAGTALQSPLTYDYDELTVGTTTAFDGNFFTDLWGNATSDIDVRALIHGYDLVLWDNEAELFDFDPSVVSGIVVTENEAGDRIYTLTIYDDLYYCDSTPITAADYAFSILLQIAPEMEAIGANVNKAEYILGYDDYISGRTASLAGLRILNDYTFSITIDHNYLPFFYEQALLECTPYPISVIAPGCVAVDDGNGICIVNEDEKIEEPIFTADLLKETILDPDTGYLRHPAVTCGPYRLTSFDGTTATFEINPQFKGNARGIKPSIERLIFKTVKNETMITELSEGDYGLLNKCVNVDTLMEGMKLVSASNRQFAMSNYARTGLSYISFCCEKETVGSEAVRKAIAYCLNKDQLISDYVGNFGQRVDGYYGIGQWMYKIINGATPYPLENPAEGDAEAMSKYEAEKAAWESLNLDGMKVYDLDVNTAVDQLTGDGWVLNRDGEEFDPEKDDVRCKEIDGELVALDLTMFYPEGNRIVDNLDENFINNLKEAGIALSIEPVPMDDLLDIIYRRTGEERGCDMIYLATNFKVNFDPSLTFLTDASAGEGTAINIYNTTSIQDQELYDLAVNMRRTEPGKILEYCEKWVAFEERFAEVLPMIPVYSNVYFDFYPTVLQNYNIEAFVSWGQAIVEAYMSDPADEEEPLTE